MNMMSAALAASPLVRFTPDEREFMGDGIPRDFGGRPLDWYWDILAEIEEEKRRKEGN